CACAGSQCHRSGSRTDGAAKYRGPKEGVRRIARPEAGPPHGGRGARARTQSRLRQLVVLVRTIARGRRSGTKHLARAAGTLETPRSVRDRKRGTTRRHAGRAVEGERLMRHAFAGVLLLGLVGCGGERLQFADGTSTSIDEWKGRWVLVNYWAEWCAPCRDEIPELNSLLRDHAD